MSFKLYHQYKKHILHLELVWGEYWKSGNREDESAVSLARKRDNAAGQDRINEEHRGRRGREREEAGERVQSLLALCSEHLKRHHRDTVMKQQLSAQRGPAAGRK